MSYAPFTSIPSLNRLTERACEEQPAFAAKVGTRRPSRPPVANGVATLPPGKAARAPARIDYPMIVHCHLCWDWVWQRPQQFLSRLSHRHRVLFVEMHPPDEHLITPAARLRGIEAFPNISLLQMQFPAWRWNDGEFVDRQRREILEAA